MRLKNAGGGTRTHTVLPPTDFESVTSTIPSHRQVNLSIYHSVSKSKKNITGIDVKNKKRYNAANKTKEEQKYAWCAG